MRIVSAALVILFASSAVLAAGEWTDGLTGDPFGAANDESPGDGKYWVERGGKTWGQVQTGYVFGNESNFDGIDMTGTGMTGGLALDQTSKWSPLFDMTTENPAMNCDYTAQVGIQGYGGAAVPYVGLGWMPVMMRNDLSVALNETVNLTTGEGVWRVNVESDGTNQRIDLYPHASKNPGSEPYAKTWWGVGRTVMVDYNGIDPDGHLFQVDTDKGQNSGMSAYGVLDTERDRFTIATGLSTGIIDVKVDIDASALYTANETANWRRDDGAAGVSGVRYNPVAGLDNVETRYVKATISYRDNGDANIAAGNWTTPQEFGMGWGLWTIDNYTFGTVYGGGVMDYIDIDQTTARDPFATGMNWLPVGATAAKTDRILAMPGDADRDGDCDYSEGFMPPDDGTSDLNILIANKGTGTTWKQGDFDNDGDVDYSEGFMPPDDGISDLNILIAAAGSSFPPAEGADQGTGVAEMIYNYSTGEVKFDNGGGINMMQVYDGNGGVIVANITNFSTEAVFSSSVNNVQYFNTSTAGLPTGEHSIGLVLPTGIAPAAEGVTLFFQYQTTGQNPVLGDIVFVPEPATMLLLGFGGVVALIRRKR